MQNKAKMQLERILRIGMTKGKEEEVGVDHMIKKIEGMIEKEIINIEKEGILLLKKNKRRKGNIHLTLNLKVRIPLLESLDHLLLVLKIIQMQKNHKKTRKILKNKSNDK